MELSAEKHESFVCVQKRSELHNVTESASGGKTLPPFMA